MIEKCKTKPSDYFTELIKLAFTARKEAYAPYSDFMVGAALLTREGDVFTGCNIENAAFSPTNCAERTAFFKAVSEGRRHFSAIAVVGGKRGTKEEGFDHLFPCGICRQVMAEFCDEDFEIVTAKDPADYRITLLKDLLPNSFGPGNLSK